MDGAAQAGERLTVLPTSFHLLWSYVRVARKRARLIPPRRSRKSLWARVDIRAAGWLWFSRSQGRQKGSAETNCRAALTAVAGLCGGGAPKPGFSQDGDGTDDRTGWLAVIRGRRRQYRSSQYPAMNEQYLGEGAGWGARTGRFGSGVPSQSTRRTGDGAGCRRVTLAQVTE